MVLEIVLGWQSFRFHLCALALQPVTSRNQRALPILHGCLGWNDSNLYHADSLQLQRRYPADAGEHHSILG